MLLAVFSITMYPLANSGWGWRATGGDRDDALVLLVRESFAGRYLYHARTSAGVPISPMPGAGLLALPFVMTKQMGLQNACWLGAMILWLRRKVANYGKARPFSCCFVASCSCLQRCRAAWQRAMI